MQLLICILGAINFFAGLDNAVKGKTGSCVLNAIGFGACLFYILERMV